MKNEENVVNSAQVPIKGTDKDLEAGFGGLKPGLQYTFQVVGLAAVHLPGRRAAVHLSGSGASCCTPFRYWG